MSVRVLAIIAFTVVSVSAIGRVDAASDPLAKWFATGRCAVFDRPIAHELPYVKSGHDDLVVPVPQSMQKSLPVPWYVYDSRSGIAYRHVGQDSGVTDTIRFARSPSASVPRAVLSASYTLSGIKLGTSAATVVAKLGKPYVVKSCGLERYYYIREREGQPDELDFTISKGRVIEIFGTHEG